MLREGNEVVAVIEEQLASLSTQHSALTTLAR
jgi:hypothetical protein